MSIAVELVAMSAGQFVAVETTRAGCRPVELFIAVELFITVEIIRAG